MKKRGLIVLFVLFCLVLMCQRALAEDKTAFKTKEGIWYQWRGAYEEGDNYCTWEFGGKVCLSKSDIVETKSGKDIPDTTKIQGYVVTKEGSSQSPGGSTSGPAQSSPPAQSSYEDPVVPATPSPSYPDSRDYGLRRWKINLP